MSEKKWQDAIDAYKTALRKNPQDADAKYNLSYAMKMLKKEGGGGKNKDQNKDQNKEDKKEEQKDNKDNKDQKDQKEGGQDPKDQKPEDKKEGEGQQPQPSKLSEKQAEQILNALQQEEKKLQEKNKKRLGAPAKLEKDW